jgi:hypothetical protein
MNIRNGCRVDGDHLSRSTKPPPAKIVDLVFGQIPERVSPWNLFMD